MKKLIILPVIAIASFLNAQDSISQSEDSIKNIASQIINERTKIYSYDAKFSLKAGGKGLAQYVIAGDSNAIFNILPKKGFGGVSEKVKENNFEKEIRSYFFSDLNDDSAYWVISKGESSKYNNKQDLVEIMKSDLRKEFDLAKGCKFNVIEIKSEKVWADDQLEEVFQYVDNNGHQVKLVASFLNNQLRSISFVR